MRSSLCTTLFAGLVVSSFIPSALAQPAPKKQIETPIRKTPWRDSHFKGRPEPPLPYRSVEAFPHLQFDRPVTVTNAPNTSRLFVAQVKGKLVSFPNDGDCKMTDLVLDLLDVDPGVTQLYGVTFHPEYPAKPYVYVCYVLKNKDPLGTVISRFTIDQLDPPRADPKSEQQLLRWLAGGHNGCCLKFGPDGYLYISTGDGAGPEPPDPQRAGQDLTNVLSTIMRIDVNETSVGADGAERHYAIPKDNPFVDVDGARPEIFAFGFRNPWKFSFDRKNGDLWVGDVGWDMWELVFNVRRGGNYGWSIFEGSNPIHPLDKPGPSSIIPPVVEHHHSEARSITGGFVYHGRKNADLAGAYVYGDYNTGKIWSLRTSTADTPSGHEVTELRELTDTPHQIIGWCETNDGELLYADYQRTNRIYELVPNAAEDRSAEFPRKLSETGLFQSVKDYQFASGVEPYTVNASMWEDGNHAVRHLALPGNSQIKVEPKHGGWSFPQDSVAVRTITRELDGVEMRLETQTLHRDGNEWRPYSYIWNESQDEATLVPAEGITQKFGKHEHHVPSRVECRICHTKPMGGVLGLTMKQLNGASAILESWEDRGVFSPRVRQSSKTKPHLVDPYDASESLDLRARSYLHVNCVSCHRPGGGGPSPIHLDFSQSLVGTKLVGQLPVQGDFQLPDAKIVAAKDPLRSVLLYRLAKVGSGHMPHIGAKQVDTAGLKLIHEWIESLPATEETSAAETPTEEAATAIPLSDLTEADIDLALQSSHKTLQLAWRLHSEEFGAEVRERIVQRALASDAEHVRSLLEPFYPADQRKIRLGSRFDNQVVLSLDGDAERGKRIFANKSLQCATCHAIGGDGDKLGPPLDLIGRSYKTAEAMLLTITKPSEKILPEYQTQVVVTSDGEVILGRKLSETKKTLTLMTLEKNVVLDRNDIEEVEESKTSMMPVQLLQSLSAQEAADLLAYLLSLK